jgi:hypothetical protein
MGNRVPSVPTAVTLRVAYGDQNGEAAALALWQDGALREELLLPPAQGQWEVALVPVLAALATQADGDFAITAPLFVAPTDTNGGDPGDDQEDGQNGDGGTPQAPGQPPDSQNGDVGHGDGGRGNNTGGNGSGGNNQGVAVALLPATAGQAGGPPGSVAQAKLAGLEAEVELRAVVTVPPGLFNGSMYVADVASDGTTAAIGTNVYLRVGEFPPLVEGDLVWLHGRWNSYRGELELVLAGPQDVWKLGGRTPLRPLPLSALDVCEAVEGRLVTFTGVVAGWQGDSLLLVDSQHPASAPVRVTVRSSLAWKRPFVQKGEIWQVTGVVSQFARGRPWNGGYRVLPRYPGDLVRLGRTPVDG